MKEITEGWYIEYKRETPKPESIAKTIEAMANTYDGWIFYGVDEYSKGNSVAGAFPGIPLCDADTHLQKIRNSVSSNLNPDCHFDIKILSGPLEELGLDADRCVICVAVPQSIQAPHIHIQTAKIYRRVADSSNPVPENDRNLIEKMFERSRSRIKYYEDWISKDPELSEEELDTPFLRILIQPNLWCSPTSQYPVSVANIKAALKKSEDRLAFIPFDTIYSSAQTVVARHCGGRDPRSLRLTWNVEQDLSGEVIIPLSSLTGSIDEIRDYFSKYMHAASFISYLDKNETSHCKVVDLNSAYSILTAVVECQQELQERAGWSSDFHIKIKVVNAWRTTPFLDVKSYIEQIDRNGLPLNLTNNCISPPGTHPDSFWYTPNESTSDSKKLATAFQAGWAFFPVAGAFGISIPDLL